MGGGTENKNETDWSYPSSTPQQLWSGSGYSYDPYIIKTAQDLANLSYMVNNGYSYESSYFKLGNNIDLNYGISVNANSSNAKKWTPIGRRSSNSFNGNFDGNGYTIDGLYKYSLFGCIFGGSVKNLTMGTGYIYDLHDYDVNSSYKGSGSIAGYISKTKISNCNNNNVTIDVPVVGNFGGLVGAMEDSEISSSSNNANITSTYSGGGIVGSMYNSSIFNSYNYANISSPSGWAGGIASYMSDSSSISDSYNYADVSSSSDAGGIVGYMSDSSSISNSSNYAKISSTYSYAGGIVGYAYDDNSYCSGCYNSGDVYGYYTKGYIIGNRENSEHQDENSWSYPTEYPNQSWSGSGSSYDPYIIKTAQDLANLSYMVNDYGNSYYDTYFKLDNNIDLNVGISVNSDSSSAKQWTPIGNYYNQFKGKFDGNGYTINGLYNGSLFGYISEGSVQNLTMGTGYIYNNSNAGSIASSISNTTISNCKNNGTIVSTYNGYAGGIVGYMSDSSTVSNSSNSAKISSSYGYAGGIAGYANDDNSYCSECYNSGYISGYYTYTTDRIIGNRENSEYQDENSWSYPTEYPNQSWSGSGTEYAPYIIKTAQDLANLSYMVNNGYSYYDTYFRLNNDIDLNYGISITEYSSDAKQWISIGNASSDYPFKGKFNGNGYTISGLYSGSLFGYISGGSVENLTMGTGYIYDDYIAGSIAGYIQETTISHCTNNGTIISSSSSSEGAFGGLVGVMDESEISSSYNYTNVSSEYGMAGGIVGGMSVSSISDSYNHNYANVSSTNGMAGGIAGTMYDSSISNSYNYSYANVSSEYGTAGGIVGYADYNSYYSECYNYGSVSGSTTGIIAGNENDWTYPTEEPKRLWFGSGSSSDPYIIKTAQDLANLSYMVNNGSSYEYTYFELACDIDLNYGLTVNSDSYDAKEWISIGNSNPFKGNFNGKDYTIDGLYNGSLFSYISEGSVENLTMGTGYIYDSSTSSISYTGSIAGYISNTTISNCNNNGTIVSTYNDNAGGIVGYMYSSSISASSNNADVSSTNGTAGGIVGYMTVSSTISNSYNNANVTSTNEGRIGGIVGYMTASSTISNSSNYAEISSSSSYAGGIVGYMTGSEISSSSNHANVTSTDGTAGGIAGYMSYSSSISNSDNNADVSSTYGTAGGIVGIKGYNSSCPSCYNYGSVSGSIKGDIVGSKE